MRPSSQLLLPQKASLNHHQPHPPSSLHKPGQPFHRQTSPPPIITTVPHTHMKIQDFNIQTPPTMNEYSSQLTLLLKEVELLNEKAEKLFVVQEQPENAIKLLRQGLEMLHANSHFKNQGTQTPNESFNIQLLHSYHEIVATYNLAACFHRLKMMEDCADYLDMAVNLLQKKVQALQSYENYLYRNQDNNNGSNTLSNSSTQIPTHHTTSANSNNIETKNTVQQKELQDLQAHRLHKMRNLCKFQVQLCAIVSGNKQHREALAHAQRAVLTAQGLISDAQLICKEHMRKLNVKKKEIEEYKRVEDSPEENAYEAQSPQQSKKVVKVKRSFSSRSQKAPLPTQRGSITDRRNEVKISKPFENPLSSMTKVKILNHHHRRATSLTTNKGYQTSSSLSSRSQSSGRDDDCGSLYQGSEGMSRLQRERSLEKIHTFSLKMQSKQQSHAALGGQPPREPIPESIQKDLISFVENKLMIEQASKILHRDRSSALHGTASLLLNLQENPSTPSTEKASLIQGKNKGKSRDPTYYVEEQFAAVSGVILRADPVLNDLVSIIKQFDRHLATKRQQRALDNHHSQESALLSLDTEREIEKEMMTTLKVFFNSEEEIAMIRQQSKNSFCNQIVRNSLGVVKSEDWIFRLSIANILELSYLPISELNGSGLKLESYLEVDKDSMLEKIVLMSVAYFCIATEMRFLARRQTATNSNRPDSACDFSDNQSYKDSEAYHAKSLHISSQFLPDGCPLVYYIARSYVKNYLKKREQQQPRGAHKDKSIPRPPPPLIITKQLNQQGVQLPPTASIQLSINVSSSGPKSLLPQSLSGIRSVKHSQQMKKLGGSRAAPIKQRGPLIIPPSSQNTTQISSRGQMLLGINPGSTRNSMMGGAASRPSPSQASFNKKTGGGVGAFIFPSQTSKLMNRNVYFK